MPTPTDYLERVYAGVLGKLIGVYLGRPFEGWSHARILQELGEVNYYVNEKRGVPLVVSDDDITGTFTFVRALEDYGITPDLTAEQIGQTWLNYIIENKTILWWGGLGMSTEHTAYLRLKSGIPAPRSGSIALNSETVAEQIGSQIFIDSWAMIAPGNPQLAVQLATKAASVSHDGEAIYGAVVIAAMESLAFVEKDLNRVLDAAVSYIPADSTIARLITDLRRCRESQPDWHAGLALIHEKYSYEKFGGGCHMVPNHAIIILALLWGDDNFHRSLMIANTAGYDTDCNSGNVGCLLGIKNGLAGIDVGPDWRGPVADRLLLPTADGGRCISDAVIEACRLARLGMSLAGEPFSSPKGGARFHFSLPGSVQGFTPDPTTAGPATVAVGNHAFDDGCRALSLHYDFPTGGGVVRASTPTFISAEQAKVAGYVILASPTLYPGQRVVAEVSAEASDAAPIHWTLYLQHYGQNDDLVCLHGPSVLLDTDRPTLTWDVPQLHGQPIAAIGIELASKQPAHGVAYLRSLTWTGTPNVVLKDPLVNSSMWTKAWVDAMQQRLPWSPDVWIQNTGRGLLIQGAREWTDYRVSTDLTPHLAKSAGLAARVQGMQRYYALLLCAGGTVKLVKMLDGEHTLAERLFAWEFTRTYNLALEVHGDAIAAFVDDVEQFRVSDSDRPLRCGAIAIVCEEGRGRNGAVVIRPR